MTLLFTGSDGLLSFIWCKYFEKHAIMGSSARPDVDELRARVGNSFLEAQQSIRPSIWVLMPTLIAEECRRDTDGRRREFREQAMGMPS